MRRAARGRCATLARLGLGLGLMLFAGLPAVSSAAPTLLNVSYDVSREFYRDYDAYFTAHYRDPSGQPVTINQSHGGSSQQARAVADGLEADVVTMNQVTDMEFLARQGLIAPDWAKRFPDHAAPTYSAPILMVRRGNPKGIHDWADLARPGIAVVICNPKTTGNGRYAYLAAWGDAQRRGLAPAAIEAYMTQVLKNAPLLAPGGRAATSAFLQRGQGDVLVTFESEVMQVERDFGAGQVEAVYPQASLLAENPVAIVEHVVDRHGTRALASAYLNMLYEAPAQDIAAKHFLRVRSSEVSRAHASEFQPLTLFTVEEMFGGWQKAQTTHFADGGTFDRLFAASRH